MILSVTSPPINANQGGAAINRWMIIRLNGMMIQIVITIIITGDCNDNDNNKDNDSNNNNNNISIYISGLHLH